MKSAGLTTETIIKRLRSSRTAGQFRVKSGRLAAVRAWFRRADATPSRARLSVPCGRSRVLMLGFLLLAMPAAADQLVMDNGSILVGKVVRASGSVIIFDTPFAGEISVDQTRVISLVADEGVDVLLQDGTFHRNTVIAPQGEVLQLNGGLAPLTLGVADINMLNPEPWRLGHGYKWSGRFDAGFESDRGNADSDELDLGMESIWQGQRNRYTLRGVWELDELNNERNKNRWLARGKYDRFREVASKNYSGFQIAVEHEQFQDLDLRTSLGPYLGRQFYEDALLQVHAELGVVFVDEDFDIAEDRDYWGVNWELRAASEPLVGFQFYGNQEGILDLNNLNEVIMNTILGLRFPSLYGLTSAAEAVYEYDGGSVAGVDSTERTFRFKVGYIW